MSEYTPAAAYAPSRLTCTGKAFSKGPVNHLASCSIAARVSPPSVGDLASLDRYTKQLWRAKLPIASSVDAATLRLVWLTAGFSVTADRAAVGDYLCALGREEIARQAHVPLPPETSDALEALIDAGRLAPLRCCPGAGYRLRLRSDDGPRPRLAERR
jgi:hypothetical protein